MMVEDLWMTLMTLLTAERLGIGARALAIGVGGLLLARLLPRILERTALKPVGPDVATMLKRFVRYAVLGLFSAMVLTELGFDLSVLLGAAGVLTVALGFASQTSASNVISGLFLIFERPFATGDWIRIGATSGEVIGIDLLSVKLRTVENLFVRVPNEAVMKAEITNVTRFPIRRLDLSISIAYREDVARVRQLLLAMVDEHPLVLDEPRPVCRFVSYGASGVDLLLATWTTREQFIGLKDELGGLVKQCLDAAGVEIPFPHVTLYAGSGSDPLRIALIDQG